MNDLSGKYLPKAFVPLGSHLFGKGSALGSYISQTLQQLKRFYSTVKEFHHEVCPFMLSSWFCAIFPALISFSPILKITGSKEFVQREIFSWLICWNFRILSTESHSFTRCGAIWSFYFFLLFLNASMEDDLVKLDLRYHLVVKLFILVSPKPQSSKWLRNK